MKNGIQQKPESQVFLADAEDMKPPVRQHREDVHSRRLIFIMVILTLIVIAVVAYWLGTQKAAAPANKTTSYSAPPR
jgi:hypothetical protein